MQLEDHQGTKRNFIWVPHKVQKQTRFSAKKKGRGKKEREKLEANNQTRCNSINKLIEVIHIYSFPSFYPIQNHTIYHLLN